jgi:transposase
MQVITIGLDLAKNIFQIHGVDAEGGTVIRKRLSQSKVLSFFANLPRCIIGIEACATTHYWARELLATGHDVKLMPPTYVKQHIKRGKNDAADAEAICEAVMRPTTRFVPVKSAEQQSALMLHRSRDLLIRQRTMLANALRSHFAELGIVVAKGLKNLSKLIEIVFDETDNRLPSLARHALGVLVAQLQDIQARIKDLERALLAWHRKIKRAGGSRPYPGLDSLLRPLLLQL